MLLARKASLIDLFSNMISHNLDVRCTQRRNSQSWNSWFFFAYHLLVRMRVTRLHFPIRELRIHPTR